MTNSSKTKELLVEIFVEEMPFGVFSRIERLMEKENLFSKLCADAGLTAGRVAYYATPRRIVICAEKFSAVQTASLIYGPPKKIAFDAKGKPSQALKSFIKRNGCAQKDIIIPEAENDKISFQKKGLRADQIMPEIVRSFISELSKAFPKLMRWDASSVKFIRPVRNLAAFLGQKKISFKWGTLHSSDIIYLDNQRSGMKFDGSIKGYKTLMRRAGIILDARMRRDKIAQKYAEEAKKIGAEKKINPALIDEVTYLSERVTCFRGSFDKEYLSLPKEVLAASMSKNQRVFTFGNKKGNLLPHFFAVIDRKGTATAKIRKNYETILEAKLKDALFFHAEDRKKTLASRIEALEGIAFLKDLGSMREKVERILAVFDSCGKGLGLSEKEMSTGRRAAELLKTDLVTHLVGEFPSLQGIVGKNYALEEGEEAGVAEAIYEHYLPRTADDEVPVTKAGALLASLDKIDTIAGCFAIGKIPKSSADPFALRRAAVGVIKIIEAFQWDIDLHKVTEEFLDKYIEQAYLGGDIDKRKLIDKIDTFFKDRLANILHTNYEYDLIEAVLSCGISNINAAVKKIMHLAQMRGKDGAFEKTRVVIERTNNILKPVMQNMPQKEINEQLLTDPSEKELWQTFSQNASNIRTSIDNKEYVTVTNEYADLFFKKVHLFFDSVLVNDSDDKLRNNRLALCYAINRLYTENVADLSKIVVAN